MFDRDSAFKGDCCGAKIDAEFAELLSQSGMNPYGIVPCRRHISYWAEYLEGLRPITEAHQKEIEKHRRKFFNKKDVEETRNGSQASPRFGGAGAVKPPKEARPA